MKNRIHEVIKKQGRSKKWLSDLLGVSISTMNRWCANTHQPDWVEIYFISEHLGVSQDKLTDKN